MRKPKSIVIVELVDRWVKLCQLFPKGSSWQMGTVACEEPGDDQAMGQWLQKQLGQLEGRPHSVVGIIPRHQVMIRHLKLPSQDPDEIARMAALQVPSLVPYAAQEAVWGSQVLQADTHGYADVMVAVALRAIVQRLLQVVEPSRLPVQPISVSPLGLLQWYRAALRKKLLPAGQCAILVDVDHSTLEIDLVDAETPLFTRATPFSPQEPAETVLAEIRRTLATATKEMASRRVHQVVLTGVHASLPSLADLLHSELGLPVQALSAFAPMGEASKADSGKRCSFTSLVGLGMESDGRMSLLPSEVLTQRTQRQQRFQWAITSGISAIAALSAIGAVGLPLVSQKLQLRQVESHLKAISPAVTEVEAMQQQLQVMREYHLAQSIPLEVLRELYSVVPSQVALTLMILDTKGTLLLKGQARSMSEVFALVSALEGSPLFHSVQVRYANKRQTQEGEIADFEIQCLLDLLSGGTSR